ncbi:hypothetical protein AGABI2DRAFT_214792, partial [Agaricus bisporus var. bisporus H97]|uniref:hypothetical protein n=1 Tax=Agaricus bisporus var. bisporus (strain H97 / ATCC MYA-4626 / FGSC 10389) TaxID=936046 RepID=UPI00029F5497
MASTGSSSPGSVKSHPSRPPWGHRWRSSYWFTTYVVGLGVAVDVIVYSIIIPVIPFQLEHLGYTGISALSGWLLFAYVNCLFSLAPTTIPIALWSEHYNARKYPMIFGLFALAGSQIMFMEAPTYAVMCVARVIQGISSSIVWVVGLAFLCEATPPEIIGRQMGIAMAGLSFGLVLAPPIGGVLYSRFGFRGPFVFALSAAFLDGVSRFIVIEPKEAMKWIPVPILRSENAELPDEAVQPDSKSGAEGKVQEIDREPDGPSPGSLRSGERNPLAGIEQVVEKPLPLLQVIVKLSRSSRALVALAISLVYGLVYSCQEPPLPLHLQSVWGLDAHQVGILLLALSVPMVFSSPLTGWLTDIFGAEWTATFSMLLATPWWGVLTIDDSLALFGVAFALESFFTSGAISPLTAELAAVSRSMQGVGYAHIYAAFNIAYGIGTSVGPIIGGQMYDHISQGWFAICMFDLAMLLLSVLLAFPFTGERPLLKR